MQCIKIWAVSFLLVRFCYLTINVIIYGLAFLVVGGVYKSVLAISDNLTISRQANHHLISPPWTAAFHGRHDCRSFHRGHMQICFSLLSSFIVILPSFTFFLLLLFVIRLQDWHVKFGCEYTRFCENDLGMIEGLMGWCAT